ncbi:KilA-N domain-containing protein [Acinetobacter ursingii]|uniref:KilA-N domain-containing protein n=1 Tax=Acinetobacter ursingii TaxID=108980 RepID=UPI001D18C2EA|nr:KilA-N domain-containing protein [Acinetobacter ursingii]
MTSLSQNFLNPNNKPLTIGEFNIRQDEDGRYCLNDLHKASGDQAKHKPSNFLRNQQTQDLIKEVESFSNLRSAEDNRCSNMSIDQKAINVIKGGEKQGAYVVEDLVYAYAMWISPKFHLMVIRAYRSLVMEWILNEKQTISPEQAGILWNIVHTRAAGNKNLIMQMWSRLKNHFKYSASYRELKAFHFEDAKHYLEVMDLKAKSEKHEDNATLEKLQSFLDNLANRYPTLQNPIAHEIAVRFAEILQYQDLTDERLFYYVAINKGKVVVLPQTVHHGVIDLVKLADAFEPLHEFMMGYEICSQARALKKLPLKPIPR